MGKFAEAEARLFKRKYVCRGCKSVIRAEGSKIRSGNITCRRCQRHVFKPKRKK